MSGAKAVRLEMEPEKMILQLCFSWDHLSAPPCRAVKRDVCSLRPFHRVLGESLLHRQVGKGYHFLPLSLECKHLLGFYLPCSFVSLPHCWWLRPTCLPVPVIHGGWLMGTGRSKDLWRRGEMVWSYCQEAGPCREEHVWMWWVPTRSNREGVTLAQGLPRATH